MESSCTASPSDQSTPTQLVSPVFCAPPRAAKVRPPSTKAVECNERIFMTGDLSLEIQGKKRGVARDDRSNSCAHFWLGSDGEQRVGSCFGGELISLFDHVE